MLCRLIYASRTTRPLTPGFIDDIVQVARTKNELHDISGMLVFNTEYFLQVLEGGRTELNSLLRQLMADPRHADFHLIEMVGTKERFFTRWAMGYVPADGIGRATLMKHSPVGHFDPYCLTDGAAYRLLLDLADSAR